MPIPFRPPLPPDDDWAAHRREIKQCRGTVCYAALVSHFGTESPKELELRVDGRAPYRSGDGDPSISNKYRRWRQGLALPSDESIQHVFHRSGGAVRLQQWRDLVLWELLEPELPRIQRIHQLLEASSPLVRRILLLDDYAGLGRPVHTASIDRQMYLGIRNHFSLDAFLALLCLARKGELLEADPQHFLPAACAFDIFPRVLYTHPPLAYRWEVLFECLARVYWRRLYGYGFGYVMEMDTVRTSLQALQANPRSPLPSLTGARKRVIDTDPLKEVERMYRRET